MFESIIVALFFAVFLICPIVFLFPLIQPKWLFRKGDKTRVDVLKLFGIFEVVLIVLIIILSTLNNSNKKTTDLQQELSPSTQNTPQAQSPNNNTQEADKAIEIVADSLGDNMFDLTIDDLQTKDSPKGDGVFVYVQRTEFDGIKYKRNILWLVVNNQAYPINGATKNVTPDLLWLREANEKDIAGIGINKLSALETIEIVFSD